MVVELEWNNNETATKLEFSRSGREKIEQRTIPEDYRGIMEKNGNEYKNDASIPHACSWECQRKV